jgi:hypothetical protein
MKNKGKGKARKSSFSKPVKGVEKHKGVRKADPRSGRGGKRTQPPKREGRDRRGKRPSSTEVPKTRKETLTHKQKNEQSKKTRKEDDRVNRLLIEEEFKKSNPNI